jgi:hypothetical protein
MVFLEANLKVMFPTRMFRSVRESVSDCRYLNHSSINAPSRGYSQLFSILAQKERREKKKKRKENIVIIDYDPSALLSFSHSDANKHLRLYEKAVAFAIKSLRRIDQRDIKARE